MSQINELFHTDKAIVAMIHVGALPGTPFAARTVTHIIDQAVAEARLHAEAGFDAIMIENMHDRPYLKQSVGPEVVSAMTAIGDAIRQAVELPLGVQILAGANCEALAVAGAVGATFIRAENFAYAHVADEGLMPDADAGTLLRYRREIGAEHVRIFADIKKKHSSHAITADVSISEAAETAAFFGADGLVVTGSATGEPTAVADVREVSGSVALPVAVGSGVTPDDIAAIWDDADVFIVGSFIKHDGLWHNQPDPDRIALLMNKIEELRH